MSDEQQPKEPHVIYATVREPEDDEIHIECRFSDGQKFAAVKVDDRFEGLAFEICEFLNRRAAARSEAEQLAAMATTLRVHVFPPFTRLPWGSDQYPDSNVEMEIRVELREGFEGPRWAVCGSSLGTRSHPWQLAVDGSEWDMEPIPSDRSDEWLARFRFKDRDSAIAAAKAAAGMS